jgi:hypothetical protein
MLDLEDLRKHFDRLTDEALLDVAREDLVDLARDIYDAEVARRGLKHPTVTPPSTQEQEERGPIGLVALEEIGNPAEVMLARALLESAGIPSWTQAELWNMGGRAGPAPKELKLMVPAEMVEQAREVLATPISDEELAAQAEAAALPEEGGL